jgi:hypothetical protein
MAWRKSLLTSAASKSCAGVCRTGQKPIDPQPAGRMKRHLDDAPDLANPAINEASAMRGMRATGRAMCKGAGTAFDISVLRRSIYWQLGRRL